MTTMKYLAIELTLTFPVAVIVRRLKPLRIAYQPDVVLEVVASNHLLADSVATDIQESIMQTEQVLIQSNDLQHQTTEANLRWEQTSEAHSRNRQELSQSCHETLNTHAQRQSRAVSVLTQGYKLDECPIPRMFIVLPTEARVHDENARLIPEDFKLYLLCECFAHPTAGRSRTRGEIDLARHEGYDLENPSEFFKRYASYLLIMMFMIKYGIRTTGIAVPPSTSKIMDGLIIPEKRMEYLKTNFNSLVDKTILFLEVEATKSGIDFAPLDLRVLESHLKIKDRHNLYRLITPEGHVGWMCQDHHRGLYQSPPVQKLRSIFEKERISERIIENIGRIDATFYSNDKAKRFYNTLAKTPGIQELRIKLGWNATMDHVKALAKAVTQAKLVLLEIDGESLTGKALTLDVINRGRRFDPILQLPSEGHIQSLRLIKFEKFFTRVKSSSFKASPKLREFSLDSEVRFDEKSKTLENLYDHYTGLAILELRLHDDYPLTKVANDILSKLHNIESFTIKYGRFDITSSVSQGRIHSVDLTIARLDSLTSDDHEFFREREFTQLNLQFIEKEYNRRARSRIHDQGERCITVIATKTMELQSLVIFATSEAFGKLDSLSINRGKLSLTSNVLHRQIKDMAMVIDGIKDLNPSDVNFIRQGRLTSLAVRYTPREAEENCLATILRCNPKLTYLGIGCEGNQALAIIALVLSTKEQIPSLSTFELMEERLTPFDLHGECDNSTHIQTHVSFKNSAILKMQTWIRLQNSMLSDSQPLRDFIRQYGWSIVFFEEGQTDDNSCATILDIPNSKPSQLETLKFGGSKFTTIPRLHSIIERFPNLKEVGLRIRLVEENQIEKLKEYHAILVGLHLHCTKRWPSTLPTVAGIFPTRTSLPNMVSFGLRLGRDHMARHERVPRDCARWITDMVSAPPEVSSLLSSTDSHKRMEKIVLHIPPHLETWNELLPKLDPTELQHLEVDDVPQESLHLLDELLRACELKTLKINKELVKGSGAQEFQTSMAGLQQMTQSFPSGSA
ncbi:hypothetical protein BGX31_007153 [Mortierella sp. GBA43]|nr:hypothetical protein BGX31_007153 [Mortierella sp. GBA43]